MDEDGVGRRSFLGIAVAAPLAPALMPRGPETPISAMPEPAVSASGLGAVGSYAANSAKAAFGIGPWLKTQLSEAEWKAKRAYERWVSQQLDVLGYTPDQSVECMKSWSPSYKWAMQRLRREQMLSIRDSLHRELWPEQSRDRDY